MSVLVCLSVKWWTEISYRKQTKEILQFSHVQLHLNTNVFFVKCIKLKCVKLLKVILIFCLNSYFGMTMTLVHKITKKSEIFEGIFVQFCHVHGRTFTLIAKYCKTATVSVALRISSAYCFINLLLKCSIHASCDLIWLFL